MSAWAVSSESCPFGRCMYSEYGDHRRIEGKFHCFFYSPNKGNGNNPITPPSSSLCLTEANAYSNPPVNKITK